MVAEKDDLEAVREITATLGEFDSNDQERILRWVREKLGMSVEQPFLTGGSLPQMTEISPVGSVIGPGPLDIRSFVNEKDPKNDVQLAAVVAYYHRFVATPDERKDSIVSKDLIDACRQADRARPKTPAQTLGNAFRDGLLDRAEGHGEYRLNTVGENLVAMVLPGDDGESFGRRTSTRKAARKKAKKTVRKKKPAKKKKKTKKKVAKKKSRQRKKT